jgi:inosine-uridine nucleoside N-ribohydrolase
LPSEEEAVESPAAADLAELAMKYTEEKPLYVIAIGAITNIASALLLKPEIKNRIVIVWLGGHALDWPDNNEFNLRQDIAAARVVFGCGAALIMLPCKGVVSAFTVSGPELKYWLEGKNKICDYLVEATIRNTAHRSKVKTWAKQIWDVTAVAWLLDEDYMLDRLEPSPIPEYDGHYAFDKGRHFIRYVYHIDRDKLFNDLFEKLIN